MKLLILAAVAAVATSATISRQPQGYSLPQPTTGFNIGAGQTLHSGVIGGTHGFTGFQAGGLGGFTGGQATGGLISGGQTVGGLISGGQTVGGLVSSGQSLGGLSTGGLTSGSVGSTSVGAVGGSCPEGQLLQVDGSCVTPIVRRNLFVYRAPKVSPIIGPRPDVAPPRLEHNIVFIHTPEGGVFDNDPVVVPPPQQKNVIYVLNKRPEIDHSVLQFPPPEQVAPEIFFINYADGENPTLPSGGDLRSALSQASESDGEIIGHKDAIVPSGATVGVGTAGVGVTSIGTGGTGASGVAGPSGLYSTP